MRTLILAVAALLIVSAALSDTMVEPGSKTSFPANLNLFGPNGSIELKALGTGLRKKVIIKVYAGCFYVDKTAELGADRARAAIEGDFAKRIEMRFLRDVDSKSIAGAYEEGIRKTLTGHDAEVLGFCGLFTAEVKSGESIVLSYMPGWGLIAEQAGKELGRVTDPELIRAIWATWFGADPVSKDLKAGLLGL